MPGLTLHPPGRRHGAAPPAHRQRGAATLVVVMVLFFLLTLVAGYTSRNLIFEQRTSANQYRSTQALEAADAGVEWALALLNAGRVDNSCEPTNNNSLPSFRQRYLEGIDDAGEITIRNRSTGEPLMAVCVYDEAANAGDGGWTCDCAADAAPTLPTVAGGAAKPMFRVRFEYAPAPAGRNVLHLVSAGCTRPDAACIQAEPVAPGGDALAVVRALITLRSALTTPPGAPLTSLGNIAGVGGVSITNLDAATLGMTVITGGDIVSAAPSLTSLPGTPVGASVGAGDTFLTSLGNYSGFDEPLAAIDLMFHSVFSMTPATYRDQPAAVRLDCSGGCDAASLSAAANANPGRPLWARGGDVTINGDVGSLDAPVVVVLDSDTADLNFSSGTVYGLVHVRKDTLTLGAGTTSLQGALVVEGALTGAGNQSLVYSPAVLNRLRVASGSFVRVPGGWRDY